jgi:flagellar basal body-associated protein FliL
MHLATASTPIHVRLKLISIAILIVGVIVGIVIYVTTKSDGDAFNDEVVGNQVYTVTPGQYKFSQHDAENIGGKFGIISAQFGDWFFSLWHGKQLGITLAVLAIAIAAVCYFFAYVLSFQPAPTTSDTPEHETIQ